MLGLLGALVATACHAKDAPLEPASVLDVGWSGCSAVVSDAPNDGGASGSREPVCELGESRKLRFVIKEAPSAFTVRAADVVLAKGSEDGGRDASFSIEVPQAADRVAIDATAKGKRGRFTLRLAKAPRFPWLEEAKALRSRGDLARARASAEAHADDADGSARALANGMLGRIALSEGHADDAFPLLQRAIVQHRQSGRISDAVDDSFALAFALHQRSHRYAEARAALDAITPLLAMYPEGRAREPYYRGLIAGETGDRRFALALLREAESRAHALGMGRLERNARAALALEMQVLGRARASLDVLRAIERDPEASPCERVEVANDIGWGALLANEAADAHVEDARGPLERAIAVEGCADVYPKSFAHGNLARLALSEGDVDGAARHLEAARKAVKEPRGIEHLSWLDLDGRILLARRHPSEALARFDEERGLARAALLLEPEWSALAGRAEALEALGRTSDAATALLEAEDMVDRAMLLVPLGEGRGAFVADRSRSARAAVDLLVKMGRLIDGARVARHSRARVLASVERALRIERLSAGERDRWEKAVRAYRSAREALDAEAAGDWKLAADKLARATEARKERERDLRTALEGAMAVLSDSTGAVKDAGAPSNESPEPGDIELVVHPGRAGWVAFAIDHDRATAQPVPAPDGVSPNDLARALLDPVASRIDAAKRVRVRAYGAWRTVDVHALMLHGAPLIARVAVDYPLGLRADTRSKTASRGALVVGDPTSDLPGAHAEARAVANALTGQMAVRSLLRDEATSRALAEGLRSSDFVHYAGHGVFAGLEGWESALPLAGGGRLTVGDVLALAPAPRAVVLSGCEAARSDGEAEGLGLAQAFVAAGADEVIAPVRRVDDALAAKLADALYATSPLPLATALRRAQEKLRESDPSSDWAAFRVLAR